MRRAARTSRSCGARSSSTGPISSRRGSWRSGGGRNPRGGGFRAAPAGGKGNWSGAVNKLSTLSPEERAAGVVAASAGNHGQAVAWAARELGAPATIYVPLDAPMAKVEACRNYGAKTVMSGAYFEDALTAAREHVEETGGTFIPPYADQPVIAGQGTLGLQPPAQVPGTGTVPVPIGGRGLLTGDPAAPPPPQ